MVQPSSNPVVRPSRNRCDDPTDFNHHISVRAAGGELTSVQDGAVIKGALATDTPLSRPLSSARVGPSQNAHPDLFDDPCNYLG